jgi:hypothetical protein
MQSIIGLEEAEAHHPEGHPPTHPKKKPHDLLNNPGLFNFLLNYFKDLKNDNFSIMISQ